MLRLSRRRAAARRAAAAQPSGGLVPQTLLDEVSAGVVALDGNDDVLVANRCAHRLGIVRGSFLVVPELRRAVRAVRRDGVRREAQLSLPASDLSDTRVPLRAEVFLLGGGDVGVVVEDRTEATRVEAVRRDFVANVSHEIRTPVGALLLLAEALAAARDDSAAVDHFVDRITVEAQRLSRLVQELLDLSRLQGGEPLPRMETVGVDELVDDVLERLRPAAEAAGIGLRADLGPLPPVFGDTLQLGMALGNLVDNAVAYSPRGSVVTVSARATPGAVEISVHDDGVGIAAADLGRVFERFYRVDPARARETGGTGLGLAIVKHVMSNHGGEVTVRSAPGAGSTFTLRLPAAAEPVAGALR